MANRIGDFFAAQPDREEALLGIADHIRKFWTPTMRAQLIDSVQAGEATDLRDVVLDALRAHGSSLAPHRGKE